MSHESVLCIEERIKGFIFNHTKFRYERKGRTNMVELGDRVEDKITGLKGIAVGITNYLYGCQRIMVQPEESKDGKPVDTFYVDEPQLEIVDKRAVAGRVIKAEEERPHGPREDAQPLTEGTVMHQKKPAGHTAGAEA
jgi:hypothetical protein